MAFCVCIRDRFKPRLFMLRTGWNYIEKWTSTNATGCVPSLISSTSSIFLYPIYTIILFFNYSVHFLYLSLHFDMWPLIPMPTTTKWTEENLVASHMSRDTAIIRVVGNFKLWLNYGCSEDWSFMSSWYAYYIHGHLDQKIRHWWSGSSTDCLGRFRNR